MFLHQIGVYSWNWLQISERLESFLHLQSRIWAGEKEDLEFYLSLEELCLLLGHNRNARPVKRQFTRWSCCQLMGLIITSLASNAAIAKEHLRCFCYAYINYNLVFTLCCLLFVHKVLVLSCEIGKRVNLSWFTNTILKKKNISMLDHTALVVVLWALTIGRGQALRKLYPRFE